MHLDWSAYRFNPRWTRKAWLLFPANAWRLIAECFRDLLS
jgi:hypothetical protein